MYLNGVKMVNGTDVTVTSGTSVVFASALSNGDVVDIVTFGTFNVAAINADNISSGTVPVARVSGSYTSITGTGALDAGSITSGFGNIDVGSSTITTTGAITGGSLAIDNITIDGTEIDLSSGDITLDAALDIKLDAAGGDIKFLSDGTEFGEVRNISSDLTIISSVADKDIVFKGQDSSSEIEAMRIDMSEGGKVGINTSAPSTSLHVRGADATDTFTVGNTTENTQCTIRTHQDDRAVISATDGGTNRSLAFATGTTERARIDGSTGNLMVGTSSSTYNLGRIVSDVNLASYHTAVFRNNTNNTGGLFLRLMNHAGQDCGSISQTGTTTSAFTGSSDYRLKENIKYDFDGTSKLKQIKPCVFNWIADGTDSTQEGFIAHELQEIVSYAVVGKKDEMETYTDDDGKEQTRPRYQGVDPAKLVPLLVKTIQELEARITVLESA